MASPTPKPESALSQEQTNNSVLILYMFSIANCGFPTEILSLNEKETSITFHFLSKHSCNIIEDDNNSGYF